MKNEETKLDTRELKEQNMRSNHSINSVIDDEERTMLLSRATRIQKQRESERPAKQEDKLEEGPLKRAPWFARAIFWIFRKSIAPIIMIVMLVAGLYIGYAIIGDRPEDDIFQWSTWKHLWDLIFAES